MCAFIHSFDDFSQETAASLVVRTEGNYMDTESYEHSSTRSAFCFRTGLWLSHDILGEASFHTLTLA